MTAPGGLRPVRAWACLGLLLGAPLQPLLVRATEPPAKVEPADADLIEFLGSVDSDDEGWKQYLARTGTRAPAVKACRRRRPRQPAVPQGKMVRKLSIKPGLIGALLLTGVLSAGVCLPVGAQVPARARERAAARRGSGALELTVAGPAAAVVAAVGSVGSAAAAAPAGPRQRQPALAGHVAGAARRRRGSASINFSSCRRSAGSCCNGAGKSFARCRRRASRRSARISASSSSCRSSAPAVAAALAERQSATAAEHGRARARNGARTHAPKLR